MNRKKIVKPALAAVFAAFLAILSQIAIPLPFGVPITLQTFAVSLCGFILGPFWATVSITVYLGLGVVGLPVFSSFGGGIGALLGPTGGFLWGFLLLSFFCGMATKVKRPYLKFTLSFSGLLLCHIIGITQYAVLYKVNIITAFVSICLPYIIKDVICLLAAMSIAPKIKNRITLFWNKT